MDTKLSQQYRDLLNNLIRTVVENNREAEIIRCCLAVSVEELEEYIYNGKFTPSVRPVSPSIAVSTSTVDASMAELELDDEEMGLAVTGRKIDAIKQFRIRRGCGLLEAKNTVEAFISSLQNRQKRRWIWL